MRIPLSWLREYVDLPEDATAEGLLADLIKVGIEEEAIHRPSDELHGPIVVGQVLSLEKEEASNGKTINWTQVRVAPEGEQAADGGADVRGIVCGAHNFVEGDKVVVTLPGAVLPGDFRIAARKTYGHVSDGMIASVRELGIGEDHDGILVLSTLGLDPEVGTDALELLGLGDEAAEVEITPDRGYQLSLRGIARSYTQVHDEPFNDPADAIDTPASLTGGYEVRIEDNAPIYGNPGASRFVARTVRGIDPTRPTPTWMSARLRLAGIRSISLPVDISNYVMLELGQPLHFYDLAKLSGPIVVRRATEGERITTLDDKDRALSTEDLLITDDSGAIGIAGVMGGASTEVSDTTTDVLIEAATFDTVSIGRTRRRHKLPSEASKRFERGVDPLIAPVAAQRAANLLAELAGGDIDPAGTDAGEVKAPIAVVLPEGYPSATFGAELTDAEVERALTKMGATFQKNDGGWLVSPPSWRPDVLAKEDLAEDIAVLVGYDRIPSRLPVPPAGRGYTREQKQRRLVAQSLADAGLVEVITLPFVSESANEVFGPDGAVSLKLANPISAEFGYLRQSVLPGLAEAARRNVARGFKDLALFESGLVFLGTGEDGSELLPPLGAKPADEVLAELEDSIPPQPRMVGGLLAGHAAASAPGVSAREWDWADALDYARLVGQVLGVDLVVSQGSHAAFHPGRTASLALPSGAVVGVAGELHPNVVKAEGLPARAAAFEVDLDAVIEASPDVIVARSLSGYPVATQDVALIVDAGLPAGEVEATLREGAGELLESVHLFDDYRGAGIDEGKKSLAFGLVFRAADRTLTADEASEARSAAVALAGERHGAVQR